MQTTIKLSVRTLVEFVLRSGDLVSSFSGRSRALAGTKAHQKVQKSQPDHYRPEVSLSHTVTVEDFVLEISGRADGIIEQAGVTVIDEIKSTNVLLDTIRADDNPLFWAQAKCYAYIYALQQNLDSIQVQLTYYQLEDRTCKRFLQCFRSVDLAVFFIDLVNRYLDWASLVQQAQANRNHSIQELNFPFDSFRAGQREFAVAVYRSIAAGTKLFAEAPTGIGKTMASIFPAVKAMGEDKVEQIVYLTAKSSARDIAEQALIVLRQRGLLLKSLTLTAKEKICFAETTDCDPQKCPYAHGHYDRIQSAMRDIYTQPVFSRSVIEEYAEKHQVCPFEFSLDLALWSDCVICDYNYVFDPRVSLKRMFSEDALRYCLLIDEAHNLVDRAREMFSASLAKKPVSELKQTMKAAQPKLSKALGPVLTWINRWGKACEQDPDKLLVQKEVPVDSLAPMHKFIKIADDWLAKNEPALYRDQLLQIYFDIHAFLRTAEEYGEDYVFYVEKDGTSVTGKLFCMDPSRLLKQVLLPGRPAVFFSATLSPLEYFKDTLGGDATDCCLAIDSPFPRNHLHVLVADSIGTTYKARESTYGAVVEAIHAVVEAKPGNYLAFFPSYRYLDEVSGRYGEQYGEVQLIRQSARMTDTEREEFLACFTTQPQGTLVGFAVLGGAFGEGIDLTGERLSGAVIVGIGLPQVCPERNTIRTYYEEKNGMGFEYAYLYPGMNKVLQAAGRVIRTDEDRGVVLLIDERFSQPRCRKLLPDWWKPVKTVRGVAAIQASVLNFWRRC